MTKFVNAKPEAAAMPAVAQRDDVPGFVIETVRVIRKHERYQMGGSGPTIGESIDIQIARAIDDGDELQDIAVHFERSDWSALVESLTDRARTRDY